jgi:uncharacterized membrane protein YagU involved in acid resistance
MTKAKRAMKEDIKLIDLVIELVDARVPLGSRNPDIDELAKGKGRIVRQIGYLLLFDWFIWLYISLLSGVSLVRHRLFSFFFFLSIFVSCKFNFLR